MQGWLSSIFLSFSHYRKHPTGWGLRQLHVPKTFVQTIDITLKYSYILGKHLHQQIECVQLRTVGQKVNLHLFGSLLGLLYLSTKNHTKEVYEAMLLRGYGMDTSAKKPSTGRRKTSFYWIGGSHDLHDLTWLERKPYDYHSGWKLPLYRRNWCPRYSTPDSKETVGLMGPNGAGKSTLFKILVGLALSSGQYHFKDWTIDKDFWKIPIVLGKSSSRLDSFSKQRYPIVQYKRLWWTGFWPTSTRLIGSWNRTTRQWYTHSFRDWAPEIVFPYIFPEEKKLVAIASVLYES